MRQTLSNNSIIHSPLYPDKGEAVRSKHLRTCEAINLL